MNPIPIPQRQPLVHGRSNGRGRTCWICGKAGGTGFTAALRLLGYEVPRGTIAYAHGNCLAKAKLRREAP